MSTWSFYSHGSTHSLSYRIQLIPRGLDRRCAAIRLQALEAAKANAETLQGCPLHPSPDSTGGTWPQAPEEGPDSTRDKIRKRPALAEKWNLEQLLNGAIEDQEK